MNMKILALFFLGLVCVAAQPGCTELSEDEVAYHQVVSAISAFTTNLYQELVRGVSGNVILSPLSAAVVLALTWEGARERTAQQLGDAMHLPLSRRRVADGFRQLMDTLPAAANQSVDEALLRLANKIYIQSGFDVKEAFQQTAVEDFRSGVQELDFADTENARNTINEWVANNTEDKITDLIPEGILTVDSRIVLVNAIYLRAAWSNQFQKRDTSIEPFHVSQSEQVNASMMHGTFLLSYAVLPELNTTALRIPYKSSTSLNMVILLPDSVDGLQDLERNLGQLDMSEKQFETRQVGVAMPKFTTEITSPLTDILQKLGVEDMFTGAANLSGISKIPLSVSDVIQKAYIKVDESGTEAAAATAVIIGRNSVVMPSINFNVDHPFIYCLESNGVFLFVGRVINPNE